MSKNSKGLGMALDLDAYLSLSARVGVPKVRPGWFGHAVLLACALALPGCVTINIYFPAAAAEKAADRIIDEVWQLKEGGAPVTVKPAPEEKK